MIIPQSLHKRVAKLELIVVIEADQLYLNKSKNLSDNDKDIVNFFRGKIKKETDPKNEKAMRVMRVIESGKYDISATEAGEMCGVNRAYFTRNNAQLWNYRARCDDASEKDIKWVKQRREEMWLQGLTDPRDIMGAILGHMLKYEYKMLGHIRNRDRAIQVGRDVLSIIVQVKSRKEENAGKNQKRGVPINSRNKALKRLMLRNTKTKFMDDIFYKRISKSGKGNSYISGKESIGYELTRLGAEILDNLIQRTIKDIYRISRDNTIQDNHHTKCSTHTETYTTTTICLRVSATFTPSLDSTWMFHTDFIQLHQSQLVKFSLRTLLHLFYNISHFDLSTNTFMVSLNHLSRTDPTLGRCYNIFSRFHDYERYEFRKCNYDMSAALQSISLQYTHAKPYQYPLLTKYVSDPAFKREFRQSIADDLKIDTKDVKRELTSFANGKLPGKKAHPDYKLFAEESDDLRREFMAEVHRREPAILESAIEQSKREVPTEIDWEDTDILIEAGINRNLSSVFFFCWTHFERKIRKEMLTLLPDGIEVHDAVYSDVDIDTSRLEYAIKLKTGFNIKIDRECK